MKRVGELGGIVQVPAGIDNRTWRQRIPLDNPMTPAKVALGKALYFDKRLSANGTVSCASCHDPASAFADHIEVGRGISGRTGTRNAPTILNAMFNEQFFWDGRASSLEEQAKQPIMNAAEMGMKDYASLVHRLAAVPKYRRTFRSVFGREGITIETICKAIAAYERTLLSGNSPLDRFLAGDTHAITEPQKRGWELFRGKARCVECHLFSAASPFFTDYKFHNTGVAGSNNVEQLSGMAEQLAKTKKPRSTDGPTSEGQKHLSTGQEFEDSASTLAHVMGYSELGRYLVTRNRKDLGAFRTPTLRDVELTTPYMHNGSLKTLIDVVRFYNRGGERNPNLDERMHPLHLSEEEINWLVEFLRALTSDDVLRQTQATTPQTRPSVAP